MVILKHASTSTCLLLKGEDLYSVFRNNLDSVLKSRHCFANKVFIVKAMVFLVVMYGYESWTIRKAEH